jgi:hypothetical protein
MAEFVIGTDVTVSPDKPIPIGRQLFRLVVIDDSGNASKADQVEVIVADQSAPTAVLKAPKVVAAGQSFGLDGSASFDVGGGKVVKYVWTYVGPAT